MDVGDGEEMLTTNKNRERNIMLSRRKRAFSQHGFSLIELVAVMAIISILVVVAYPSYQSYALRIHRTEARVAMMDVADRMHLYYFENKTYTDDLNALGLGTDPYITENGYYSIDVDDNGGSGGACPIAICFELVAPAIGRQAMDTDCAEFWLHAAGDRTALTGGGTQNNNCW